MVGNYYTSEVQGFSHTALRLRQRYGIQISVEEYAELNAQYAMEGIDVGEDTKRNGNRLGWLDFRGHWVLCVWDTRKMRIRTTLEPHLAKQPATLPRTKLSHDHATLPPGTVRVREWMPTWEQDNERLQAIEHLARRIRCPVCEANPGECCRDDPNSRDFLFVAQPRKHHKNRLKTLQKTPKETPCPRP